MEGATEYGGRTLRQRQTFDFTVSMARYLAERARPVSLPRARYKNPELPAAPMEIAATRGLRGNLN
eukprot:4462285-Pyramimonas_sp.AAC.1